MVESNEIPGFSVLETLGHGARSTIFKVKDTKDNVFALKQVVKKGDADQRFVDQAILEHQVASQFKHPALRQSHKIIRRRQLIKLSEVLVLLEYVDGYTIEQRRPRNMMTLCMICKEVAAGLEVLHKKGFVHADIKPNNIMVTEEGQVKIIDLGQSCTKGTIKPRIQGTPDYIAPEQVRRRRITPQTDVFNLGATMYWLLTNQHAPTLIPKGTPGVSLKTDQHNERKARPPRAMNPDVPPALSSLVMSCIEHEPSARPETMYRVRERLDLAINQTDRDGSTAMINVAESDHQAV